MGILRAMPLIPSLHDLLRFPSHTSACTRARPAIFRDNERLSNLPNPTICVLSRQTAGLVESLIRRMSPAPMRLIYLLLAASLVVAGCTYTQALPTVERKVPFPYRLSPSHPFNEVCKVRLISVSQTGEVTVTIFGQLATAREGKPFLLVHSRDGTGVYLHSVDLRTGEVIYGMYGYSWRRSLPREQFA